MNDQFAGVYNFSLKKIYYYSQWFLVFISCNCLCLVGWPTVKEGHIYNKGLGENGFRL